MRSRLFDGERHQCTLRSVRNQHLPETSELYGDRLLAHEGTRPPQFGEPTAYSVASLNLS